MKNKRMKYTAVCMLSLVFISYSSCKGQNKTKVPKDNTSPENQVATIVQGPNRTVRTIRQDRQGNIWLASAEGIIRYDGKSFTHITSKVSAARFFSVLEDRKGNFWFASAGSGVYYYDGKSFQNFTTKEGLASDRVTNIYEDKSGHIWFGTERGASRYDGKRFRNFKMREASPVTEGDSVHHSMNLHQLPEDHWMHNDVNSIIEDKTGKLWFGTRGYTFVYDGKAFTTI